MNLKPTKRNILVKITEPEGRKIIVPSESQLAVEGTTITILALSKSVEAEGELAIGDVVFTRPGRINFLPVSEDTMLIHADIVEGIII